MGNVEQSIGAVEPVFLPEKWDHDFWGSLQARMEAGCGSTASLSRQNPPSERWGLAAGKGSELGPLAWIDDKIVWWTAPDPNASHKAPGKKNPRTFSHMHTAHRPHAAPKGQEETLIRGRGNSSESETASMGAEEPEQAGLTSAPPAQALYPDGKTLGPLSWKGVGWTPGGPYGQKLAWLLGPIS